LQNNQFKSGSICQILTKYSFLEPYVSQELWNYSLWRKAWNKLFSVLSTISGQGVFGVRTHAKNTRLSRFIEM